VLELHVSHQVQRTLHVAAGVLLQPRRLLLVPHKYHIPAQMAMQAYKIMQAVL
jgi:hypothetical protein